MIKDKNLYTRQKMNLMNRNMEVPNESAEFDVYNEVLYEIEQQIIYNFIFT